MSNPSMGAYNEVRRRGGSELKFDVRTLYGFMPSCFP